MLEDWHLRILIQSQAIMVEAEGMKAENDNRKYKGEAQAYDEDKFDGLRMELDYLSRQLTYQAGGGGDNG